MNSFCQKCGHFMFYPDTHLCPPEWEVRDEDECDNSDWKVVRGHEPEDAAAKYAENYDDRHGDGPHSRTVLVRSVGSSDQMRFNVSYEYSIDYHAHKATGEAS